MRKKQEPSRLKYPMPQALSSIVDISVKSGIIIEEAQDEQ